jgi:hypothetical protein
VELVWQEQDSEQDKAKPARFHADGPEPARLIGEFGALLSDGCESAASTSSAGRSC